MSIKEQLTKNIKNMPSLSTLWHYIPVSLSGISNYHYRIVRDLVTPRTGTLRLGDETCQFTLGFIERARGLGVVVELEDNTVVPIRGLHDRRLFQNLDNAIIINALAGIGGTKSGELVHQRAMEAQETKGNSFLQRIRLARNDLWRNLLVDDVSYDFPEATFLGIRGNKVTDLPAIAEIITAMDLDKCRDCLDFVHSLLNETREVDTLLADRLVVTFEDYGTGTTALVRTKTIRNGSVAVWFPK